MKLSLAVALLLSSSKALKLDSNRKHRATVHARDPDDLPACPDKGSEHLMDGMLDVIQWPLVGATCRRGGLAPPPYNPPRPESADAV